MYFALLFPVTVGNRMPRLAGTVKAEYMTNFAGVDIVLLLYDKLNRRRSQT